MPRSLAPRRTHLLALVALLAALATACAGEDSAPGPSSAGGATSPPTATRDATPPLPLPMVSPPRDDGLTGAPVPPPTVVAAEFDAGRLDERAGSFPPLDDPAVVPAAEASWMQGDDLVLGAAQGGEARAYPLFMMTFHHVANDTLAGEPYLVTF